MTTGEWHRDFPEGTARDVLDIIVKALTIRSNGTVTITVDEMRTAGASQAEMKINADKSLTFRIERN